jgi:hypothetical protein|tara:strand:- start:5649 stop:6335 length:687 start_codon:yes stop_codon:yes gene_type:complete
VQKVYDIVFISYFEPNAEQNFDDLYNRFNTVGVFGDRVKRVTNVKGIHNAHVEAAKLVNTSYFFVVDGDAKVVQDFKFAYTAEEKDIVHVYRSVNPINDLTYGYGGVKLLPTTLTCNMDTTTNDMTTSISNKFKVMNEVSNITAFDTDAFSTWKSAFRECAKLASKTIDRQDEKETNDRLKTWTTHATGSYKQDALRGARAGMQFGLSNSSDLNLINDFEWLKEQFDD